MSKIFNLIISLACIGGLFILGCAKEVELKTEPSDLDVSTASDCINLQDLLMHTFHSMNHFAINESGLKGLKSDVTTTITTGGFPKTLTIDFGDSYTDHSGHIFKGKLIGEFTDYWFIDSLRAGTMVDVSFEGFGVNSYVCSGGVSFTYDTVNDAGGAVFSVLATSFIATGSDGHTATCTGQMKLDWIEGFPDLNNTNDVYLLSGYFSGTDQSGSSFTMDITTQHPLLWDVSCYDAFTFLKGVFQVSPEGKYYRTVDFGEGFCDNRVLIDFGGYERWITMAQ